MTDDQSDQDNLIIIEHVSDGKGVDRQTINPKHLLSIRIKLPSGAVTMHIEGDELAIRSGSSLLSIQPRAGNYVHIKPVK